MSAPSLRAIRAALNALARLTARLAGLLRRRDQTSPSTSENRGAAASELQRPGPIARSQTADYEKSPQELLALLATRDLPPPLLARAAEAIAPRSPWEAQLPPGTLRSLRFLEAMSPRRQTLLFGADGLPILTPLSGDPCLERAPDGAIIIRGGIEIGEPVAKGAGASS